MAKTYGILLVSHVEGIAEGLFELLKQVAADVTIKTAGGAEEGGIGTSFDKINDTLKEFEEDIILVFYDLGSAKMNVEMAMDFTEKEIVLYDAAFVEGAYVAASLLQTGMDIKEVEEQLKPLVVKE